MSAALVHVPDKGSPLPVFTGQMAGALTAYRELQQALDRAMPDQIMSLDGKPFRKKGYWRALAVAFNLTVEPVEERREVARRQRNYVYVVTYRAATQTGRAAIGDGACAAAEKQRGRMKATEHNVRGHAHTRAYNRAVSNLVGFGEVSAEEVDRESSRPPPRWRAWSRGRPRRQRCPAGFEDWLLTLTATAGRGTARSSRPGRLAARVSALCCAPDLRVGRPSRRRRRGWRDSIACDQRTPEWHTARLGKLTGSRAADACTGRQASPPAAAPRAGARARALTGQSQDCGFGNADMERGIQLEPAAFAAYEAETGMLVTRRLCGARHARGGLLARWPDRREASRDQVPGGHTHFDMCAAAIPAAYRTQITHGLWLTGRSGPTSCRFTRLRPRALQVTRLYARDIDLAAYDRDVRRFLAEVDRDHAGVPRVTRGPNAVAGARAPGSATRAVLVEVAVHGVHHRPIEPQVIHSITARLSAARRRRPAARSPARPRSRRGARRLLSATT